MNPSDLSFGIVSRQITMLHYCEDIGVDCDEANLRKLEFYTGTDPAQAVRPGSESLGV